MNWQQQLQTLLDKSHDSRFDVMYNDVFHEAIEQVSGGLNVNQLRALSSELPNVSEAFNEALKDVASAKDIDRVTKLGKEWSKTQDTIQAMITEIAGSLSNGLTHAMNGIQRGLNDLRNNKMFQT